MTLEDTDRTARRVLGGAHPTTVNIERALANGESETARRPRDAAEAGGVGKRPQAAAALRLGRHSARPRRALRAGAPQRSGSASGL